MKWSPAPSPIWPTHQAQQSTARPCPLLVSCTPASSLPASETLEDMVEERRSGLIPRTTTGAWTTLLSSGHSCRKRRASWGMSLTLYCWPLMDMAGCKFGARMSLCVCGNDAVHPQCYTSKSVYRSWRALLHMCKKPLVSPEEAAWNPISVLRWCHLRTLLKTWTGLKEGLNWSDHISSLMIIMNEFHLAASVSGPCGCWLTVPLSWLTATPEQSHRCY